MKITAGLINKIAREAKKYEEDNALTLREAWECARVGILIKWRGEEYKVYGNGSVYIIAQGNASEYEKYIGTVEVEG